MENKEKQTQTVQQSAGAGCSVVLPLLEPALCTMQHKKVLKLCFY